MTHPPDGPWYYQQLDLGFNYRMIDIQAALGTSQMKRLDEFVEKRNQIATNYDKLLEGKPVLTPFVEKDVYSSFHLYIIRVKLNDTKYSHKEIFERFRNSGILVNLHYIPVYRQPYFEKMGFNKENFPEAEKYYAEAISLPMYPTLTYEQQQEVVHALETPLGYQTLF